MIFIVFGPLILFLGTVAWLSPLIGLVCAVAAIFCGLVLFIPARRMVRSERNRLRVFGAILIPLASVAMLAFIVVAIPAFYVAASFYGMMSGIQTSP